MQSTDKEYRYQYTSNSVQKALDRWQIDESRNKVYFTETVDHWQLAITHYEPKIKRFEHPVLLCHGLGSNRLVFHAGASNSMGEYFASIFFTICLHRNPLRQLKGAERPGPRNHRRRCN